MNMTTEKVCSKCGVCKPIDSFYKSPGYKDGHHTWCKNCVSQYYKSRYSTDADAIRDRNNRYRKFHPEYRKRLRDNQRKNNPEQYRARKNLNSRIRRGTFPSVQGKACSHCGLPATEYHHWSYAPEHWFDVIPLCRECHKCLHSGTLNSTIPVPPTQ